MRYLHSHPCKSQPESLLAGTPVMMPVTTSSFKGLKCSQTHCFPSHRGDVAVTFPCGMTHNRTPLSGNSLLPTVDPYSLPQKTRSSSFDKSQHLLLFHLRGTSCSSSFSSDTPQFIYCLCSCFSILNNILKCLIINNSIFDFCLFFWDNCVR